MSDLRRCSCDHGFPVCACDEAVFGSELLTRSRWLSHLAGWPARVTPESIAAVIAEHGRPLPVYPVWLALPRIEAVPMSEAIAAGEPCGCGAGQGRA